MHAPHRLCCQHAQTADVTAVSCVISSSFGSSALTEPLTDSLPWATSPQSIGCVSHHHHPDVWPGAAIKCATPEPAKDARRIRMIVPGGHAPSGCVARFAECAGPVLPSDQGGASDGPGLCRCGRPLRLEGGRGSGASAGNSLALPRRRRRRLSTGLSVGRVDVGRGEVWAPAYEPKSVAPLPGLQCGIGGDLDDDGRGDLGQRNGRAGLGPAADTDLFRPRMIVLGGLKDCAEVGGLLGAQRDRAPDRYEFVAAVAPGDRGLGSADRAEHAADDDLDGVTVPDLLEGWILCRALSRGGGYSAWCTTLSSAVRHGAGGGSTLALVSDVGWATGGRVRAFAVWLPSGVRYWTVLDRDLRMHRAADDFLRHLRFGRGCAESTTRAYATSVSLYLLWCGQVRRDWWDAVDRLGAFMLWLRHAEGPAAGAGTSGSRALVVRQPGRINAVLVAVREFLKHAVAAGDAPVRVLSALYEIGDDRWLPEDLRGERTGLRYVARPRHRLSVPERHSARSSDDDALALLRACRSPGTGSSWCCSAGPGCGVARRQVLMSHRNARLTFHGRCLLVRRVRGEGMPVAHVAKAMGVSRQCAHRWVARFDAEGEAGLYDRLSRPHRMPTRTPAETEQRVLELRRVERRAAPSARAGVIRLFSSCRASSTRQPGCRVGRGPSPL